MNLLRTAAGLLNTYLPANRGGGGALAVGSFHGHLTYANNGAVTAWYNVPTHHWAYVPVGRQQALLAAIAGQYAELEGCHLHVRRVSRPYPVGRWIGAHGTANPNPLPDSAHEDLRWTRHVYRSALQIADGEYHVGRVMLGVTLPPVDSTVAAGLLRQVRGGAAAADAKITERLRRVTEAVSGPGLEASEASELDIARLMYHSVALGLPAPKRERGVPPTAEWLLNAIAGVQRFRSGRYGRVTRIVSEAAEAECYVAVLAVGQMGPQTIPETHQPWLHLADRAPFPVDLSSRFDVVPGTAVEGHIDRRLKMITSQQDEYREHHLHEPRELSRHAERAMEILDEVTTGTPDQACRAVGWHLLAVTGKTHEQVMDRVSDLTRMYTGPRIALEHPTGQAALLREFVPGEPYANVGYLRELPVRLAAAALPQASSRVGDNRGDLIGSTVGVTRAPVLYDPHFPMQVRERSGLSVFVAEPGAGKSAFMGAMAYLNTRRGVRTTILDPSGPLTRLAELPELAAHTRVVHLRRATPGTLGPYAMVPEPVRAAYSLDADGDGDYARAFADARADRKALVGDVLRMLLPPNIAADREVEVALMSAVRAVPNSPLSTLDDVVAVLGDGDVVAKQTAESLLDAQDNPLAEAFFGPAPAGRVGDDAMLTIISLAGLEMPDGGDRAYWSASKRLTLPVLHVAHWLAARRCYVGEPGPNAPRKFLGIDEAHLMSGWASGRALLDRVSRDSRKWNLAALVASQNPDDILRLDAQNLVSTVFVGRIADDEQIADGALRLLHLPTGMGFEDTLAGLSAADTRGDTRLGYREVLIRDVDRRIQRVRLNFSHIPGLLAALDTTPGGPR